MCKIKRLAFVSFPFLNSLKGNPDDLSIMLFTGVRRDSITIYMPNNKTNSISHFVRRAGYFARNPRSQSFNAISRLLPHAFYRSYAEKAALGGLEGVRFLLSFDCDTVQDIEVVQKNHSRLEKMGILPIYLVPGQLLEKGIETYRSLYNSGSKFLNHGYYIHTHYDPENDEYQNIFFYDQIPAEKVVEDIVKGHESHQNLLGQSPKGFRVPHFGTFQRPKNLNLLYDTLNKLGYQYSSSTSPIVAWRKGPTHRTPEGLWEFPLSGWFSRPYTVLDSWSFRYAPHRTVKPERFLKEIEHLYTFFSEPGRVGLINIYADPFQVHDWPDFFKGMDLLKHWIRPSYEAIIEEIQRNKIVPKIEM